ncbi:NAD(P)H-hydrate dehydratase [Terricaulis sp.]|uniref:NAD(P)H-hydrate dehydratase n=1 Tax=Terricaulis sp. TaxID=2768686 RepID=UPI003783C404
MSCEIISIAQMRAIDEAAAKTGTPTFSLMESAGSAVAEAVTARFSARPTAVLCGPGNNGGDGWVAARVLKARGWPVWVVTLVPRDALKGDAAAAAAKWDGEIFAADGAAPTPDLVVDALFGAGLARPLTGDAVRLARAFPNAVVVAVDVPSGVDGDSGKAIGETHFQAALTVTFVRKKPAHVLEPSRSWCGRVVVADIGAGDNLVAAQNVTLFENDPALWRGVFPWPGPQAHKHARGSVAVATGGLGRTGAGRLAARGALRVGAGLVTVLSPPDALLENALHLTAIMLRKSATPEDYAEAVQAASCAVLGPAFGVTSTQRANLDAVLASKQRCPLVLDADALTLLAPIEPGVLASHDVVTPHLGEFRRAFPSLLESAATRIEAARVAAARAGSIVLLKGPDTVVAEPGGRAIVNATGSPFLATAGSGDVLAGVIAGLIGQGMPSFEAAAAGAWLHGRAGEAGPGLIAEDIPENLPAVLNALAPAAMRSKLAD